MHKEKIVVFGSGDFAQLANYYFDVDSNYEVVAFTVDKKYAIEDSFEGKPLIPFDEVVNAYPPSEYKMFIAVSYAQLNKLRERIYHEAKALGYTLVSYVSSRCSYMSQYPCGDNCFILEDNTIQPFVKIGNNVTLWSGNHIGHHSTIKDHNYFSSHVVLSGHCVVESYCFLGVNATIAHKTVIAEETLLGAGAYLAKDSVKGGVYVPARGTLLEKRSNEFQL
jgi:sugar O-acyltransferase (sialic acid O-acetyltransferase NeuD family)